MGGYRLHIVCQGKSQPGVPAVLLDTGLAGDHTAWGYVMPQVAQFAQVYAYDRAGEGYSDSRPAGMRLTGQFLADELEALIQGTGIAGRLVLVGHSFGGHYQRIYATHYPQRAAGMVLVDCSHEEMWQRFDNEKGRLRRQTIQNMQLVDRLMRLGLLKPVFAVMVRRLQGWSAPARQNLLRSLCSSRHWRGVAVEARFSGEVEAAVLSSRKPLGDIPLVVVAAVDDKGKPGSKRRQAWLEMQMEHAALSTRGSLWLPPGATHLGLGVYPAQAHFTIEAIRGVVQQATLEQTR